jgi:acetyl-CoA acetyltransferase
MLAMAVATGQCRVGVAWRSRKRGSGGRPWAGAGVQPSAPALWTRPFGLLRPVDEIAMLTRRYMHEYGATREHLANVAVAVRKMANRNPRAMMHDRELTREAYMQARWISEPLCLFDNCLESDGALACVVVPAARARDCRQPPAYLHAFGQGLPRQSHTMVNYWCEDPLTGPAWACARQLYRQSDIIPSDLRVAQLYDAFTPLIPLSLEGYGFCARGEGAAFTEDGALEPGGRLPINTSGGGLSEAYVHGFNLINEGVRQVRGTSTNQVDGADACLVTAGEGVPTSAMILRA